jgi:hypothetical protein
MGLKEVPFGLTETPLFEPNLPAPPSLVDWRKTVATRGRSWHGSHEFSRELTDLPSWRIRLWMWLNSIEEANRWVLNCVRS